MPDRMNRHLTLPDDGPVTAPLLADFVATHAAESAGLAEIVLAIADAAGPLARRLARGSLPGDPAAIVGDNESGDSQKALDRATHDFMLAALAGTGVHAVLSEEAAEVVQLDPKGKYDIAIDPIDGSDGIGLGAPLGLFFALLPAGAHFLRSGREIVAAGYVCFGHSVDMGVSLGNGVHLATLDPAGAAFHMRATHVRVPATARTIAYNAANLAYWPAPLRQTVLDLTRDPATGAGRGANMRWPAAAVADVHRILLRGGLFAYPADQRPGYESGRLRLVYEAFPIAFLMEQAHGAASDGTRAILDRTPSDPHQQTPLIFGAAADVAHIQQLTSINDTQGEDTWPALH